MALNRNRLAILFMATIFLLGGCTKPSERRENRELIAYVDSAYNVTGKDSVRNGLLVVQSYIDHVKGGPVDLEALSRMMGAIDSKDIVREVDAGDRDKLIENLRNLVVVLKQYEAELSKEAGPLVVEQEKLKKLVDAHAKFEEERFFTDAFVLGPAYSSPDGNVEIDARFASRREEITRTSMWGSEEIIGYGDLKPARLQLSQSAYELARADKTHTIYMPEAGHDGRYLSVKFIENSMEVPVLKVAEVDGEIFYPYEFKNGDRIDRFRSAQFRRGQLNDERDRLAARVGQRFQAVTRERLDAIRLLRISIDQSRPAEAAP